MRLRVLGLLGLLVVAPALAAEKPDQPKSAPKAEYDALVKEYQDAQQEFFKLYRAAKTEKEQNKLFEEKYPKPDKYVDRFLKLAKKYEKQPVAADAMIWVLENSRSGGAEAEKRTAKIIDSLLADHLQHKRMGEVCQQLVYSPSPAAEKLMRAIAEKNTDRTVVAQATFSLGQYLKNTAETVRQVKTDADTLKRVEQFYGKELVEQLRARKPDKLAKESEDLFQRVIDKYGDIKQYGQTTFGKSAAGELFEIRNLAIGKPAPDIQGEDIDGKKFKLSEYKGKVVVIDFWGHW